MLDKILDFLFHKALGVCIVIGAAVFMMLMFSSCLPMDFCACWCGGFGCDDSASCFESCSTDCDDECYTCFGGEYGYSDTTGEYSYVDGSSCALNECLFGRYGCESECGDCYTVCGGVNLSLCISVCDGGFCPSCTDTSYGTKRVSCLNCTSYCDSENDPDAPNYQATYLYSIITVDYYGNETEFKIYDNTTYIPWDTVSGLDFAGYYSEPNGNGTRYSDGVFPTSGTKVYAHYTDAYAGIDFTIYVYTREYDPSTEWYDNKNMLTSFVLQSGQSLAQAFNTYVVPPTIANRTLHTITKGENGDYYSNPITVIGDENGINSEYETFRPWMYYYSSNTIFIYLDYAPESYNITVSFADNYGMADRTFKMYPGDTFGEITDTLPYIISNGYVLAGLSEESSQSTNVYDPEDEITGSMHLYAVYKPRVQINYVFEEGMTPVTYDYYEGQLAKLPIPSSAVCPVGYELDCWVNSTDYSDIYRETMTVYSAYDGMTLIAKYKKATYDVSFYDGETLLTSSTYVYGTTTTLYPVSHDFEDFVGWYDNPEFSGYPVTEISATDTGDKVFYAKFQPKNYTIEMNAMGGNLSTYSMSVAFGELFTLPVPTRTGYTFNGWHYATDTGKVRLTDNAGQSLTVFGRYNGYHYASPTDLGIMVLADWTPNAYVITFEGDGISTTTTNCNHGSYLSAPSDPVKPGYDFTGWYYNGSLFDFSSTKVTGEMTLTAQFTPKTYTINLVINEANGSFSNGTQTLTITYVYGSGVLVINDTPVRDGYMFTGWYSQPGGNGSFCIQPGGTATSYLEALLSAPGVTEITLYAGWVSDNN